MPPINMTTAGFMFLALRYTSWKYLNESLDNVTEGHHELHQKFTENAPLDTGSHLDPDLLPDTCYPYNVEILQPRCQDDVYLDLYTITAIIINGIKNPEDLFISYCRPLNICSHILPGQLIIYINYSQALNCPITVSYEYVNELTLNLLEKYEWQNCTEEQDREVTEGCQEHSCRCIILNNTPIKKCTLPWMVGENCNKKSYEYESLQIRKAAENDCSVDIRKMLNSDSNRYCKSRQSTPAIPTEELKRSSHSAPTPKSAHSSTGTISLVDTWIFATKFGLPIVGLCVCIIIYFWCKPKATRTASLHTYHEARAEYSRDENGNRQGLLQSDA